MDDTPNITVEMVHQEHESHVRIYLRVFFALLVLTVLEYFYAKIFAESGFAMLVLGLMALAGIKATLVGMFFMHLKFEGRWKYLLLIPTTFLVMVFIFALFPDIAMTHVAPDPNLEEEFASALPEPGPGPLLASNR